MSCSKCNGNLDEINHTCWRGEYQRRPYLLIGKSFRSVYVSHTNKWTGEKCYITYSGTFTEYTGFREQPKFYMRYKPDSNDTSPSKRHSFSIHSYIFHNMELTK